MKHKPITPPAYLALCCSAGITLAASLPALGDTPVQLEAIDSQQPPPSPMHEVSAVPALDISGVLNHLHNQDVGGARNELSRLQSENPGWVPPAPLLQVINQYNNRNLADNRYMLLMAELDSTPESARTEIPPRHLELATQEVRRRKDGYHAMMLGWIHFQRQNYAEADRLFTQAGQWGEATQSEKARSLVSQRLAHQAVAANDHAAALRHAEQASALGSEDSYMSTGWMLFKKQAYDDALTAFSQTPPSVAKEEALAETCFQQSLKSIAAGDDDLAEQAARCSQQHGRSDVMTTLGWMLYKDGKYAMASRFFTTMHPPSEQSHYGNVLSLKASGDNLTARELSCRNNELSPRIKSVCVELSSAQMLADYQAGRHNAVLRHAIELEQYGALTLDLSALVAWSELSLEQYNAAAKRFDKLLSQQPEEASHAHGLLNSLAHSDNPTALADARIRHPLFDNILSRQTSTNEIRSPPPVSAHAPSNPAGKPPTATIDADLLAQAIELYHAKYYKRAHQLLHQLHPGIIASRDSGLLTLAGWAAFHIGNLGEARDNFLIAAKWTDDATIWLMVVEAEIALQNPERAREIIDGLPPSMERDKMLARLIPLQAIAAYHQGDYARAESLLSSSDFAPDDDNLEMLGWSRYQQGKYEAAVSAFVAAYRSKPTLARAKGLVFSHMHQRQPGKLVALADELQGPLADLTDDKEVRKKLSRGKEDWVGVSPEGVLIVQEPPKQTSAFTRALQKLEGIPGFTWGSVDHSFVDNDTHVSFLLNQGIDWLVLPGDITLNTFVEYRSMHNDLKSVYDDKEFVVGLEFQRSPFNLGIEHSPAQWRSDAQEQDITTAYLGWYHSWYKYLRRRHSTISNPFNVNAYAGSTYGRISNEVGDGGTTARGFVRQGMDWFTSITAVGEVTLNSYAAYRFRFRTEDNYWYDAHGPAIGLELQRSPFSLGLEYMWQVNPRRDTSESIYGLYLTWYYDWDLTPE